MQFPRPLKKIQLQETRRGATLIELLITVGVFSFLVVSLLAITRDGTASWRSVETRSSVQTAMRMAEREITTELIRASYSSVKILQNNTYQHAIVFKSAMNNLDPYAYPSGDPTKLGDPLYFYADNKMKPVYQRYVLYYVTRIDDTEHLQTYGFNCNSPSNPDDVCPHKILVRKDIYLAAALDSASALGSSPYIESVGDEPSTLTQYAKYGPLIWAEPSLKSQYPYLSHVRIIARDVLSFNLAPVKPDGSPGTVDSTGGLNSGNSAFLVEFDIKTFKTLEAAGSVTIGGSDLSQSQFTVQLDNRVMPGNS